jgi:hypothetical protein
MAPHIRQGSGILPAGSGHGRAGIRAQRARGRRWQAAYDAHTSSPAYRDLIADQFASMIIEFTELDHELVVGL